MTSKGLRHIQMRENFTREQQLSGFCKVSHIPGDENLSDLFTKEDKDVGHYEGLRDHMVKPREDVYNI